MDDITIEEIQSALGDSTEWVRTPYHRRSKEEHIKRTALLEEYVSKYPCQYESKVGIQITARPSPEDKHKFSAVEKITLDYNGVF